LQANAQGGFAIRGWIVAGLGTLVLLSLAAACGGSDDAGAGEEELSLELVEQNGSGQSGTATLAPTGDDSTRIVVELESPPAEPQPAHVHSGSCDDIGDVFAPLESLTDGQSESTVMLSLDELQQGNLIVHAHKSEAEFDVSVACAAIPEAVSP
jgi:hypothetical protein